MLARWHHCSEYGLYVRTYIIYRVSIKSLYLSSLYFGNDSKLWKTAKYCVRALRGSTFLKGFRRLLPQGGAPKIKNFKWKLPLSLLKHIIWKGRKKSLWFNTEVDTLTCSGIIQFQNLKNSIRFLPSICIEFITVTVRNEHYSLLGSKK